jgi:hypothetical protein
MGLTACMLPMYFGQNQIKSNQIPHEVIINTQKGANDASIKTIPFLPIAMMAPELSIPYMTSLLSGAPVSPSPQAIAPTIASEGGTLVNSMDDMATAEVSLAARATEIHGALPLATQSRTTTAVASAATAEGNSVTLVGSSEVRLRPVQRAMLSPGEVAVSGQGHAEVTLLNYAQTNNMTVNAVAASRPICPGCAVAINNAGAIPASPLKVVSTPRQPIDATFVKKPITP